MGLEAGHITVKEQYPTFSEYVRAVRSEASKLGVTVHRITIIPYYHTNYEPSVAAEAISHKQRLTRS